VTCVRSLLPGVRRDASNVEAILFEYQRALTPYLYAVLYHEMGCGVDDTISRRRDLLHSPDSTAWPILP